MHVLDPSEQRPSESGGPSAGRPVLWRADLEALQPGTQFRSLLSMVGAAEVTLSDALAHVAEQAAHTLPAADGACVDIVAKDGRRERAATAEVAAQLQELQHTLGEGPSVDAASGRRPVVSGDLPTDQSWPALSAAWRSGAVRSVLVLPLLAPSGVLGTLTLYAAARSAFDDRSRQLGVRLAASSTRTVRHALVLERARRLTAQWHLRGRDRAAVDGAIAVLMAENGVRADEAYAVLQLLGRTEQEDLVTVARAIVAAEEGHRSAPAASGDVPPPVSPRG